MGPDRRATMLVGMGIHFVTGMDMVVAAMVFLMVMVVTLSVGVVGM